MGTSKERYLFADDGQDILLDIDRDWEKHWVGMPEFVQKRQEPHQKIIVRFSCAEDVDKFAKLLDATVTSRTKDMWFPPLIVKKGEYVVVGP